jgi:hypothetical protein
MTKKTSMTTKTTKTAKTTKTSLTGKANLDLFAPNQFFSGVKYQSQSRLVSTVGTSMPKQNKENKKQLSFGFNIRPLRYAFA